MLLYLNLNVRTHTLLFRKHIFMFVVVVPN